MADLQYIKPNRLREEVKRGRKSAIWVGGSIIPIAVAFFAVSTNFGRPEAGIVGGAIIGMIGAVIMVGGGVNTIIEAGANGEEFMLKTLSGLNDNYTIFTQVKIPCPESRTGYREADFVVCGPTGIFIIEVKHNKGVIVGDEADPEWKVQKVSRGGTLYSGHMRNPIKQVRSHIFPLKKYLASKGVGNIWIDGMVVFTNRESALKLRISGKVPVLRPGDVRRNIEGHRAKRHDQHDTVVRNLSCLVEESVSLCT